MKINVGILVSYDYELLKNAIPPIYEHADTITLAIDEGLRTWKGGTFTIDPSIFTWIETFDTQNKITIYRDDFYTPELSPLENETRERNMLAARMGEGWTIQLDADEYFINFKGLVDFLKKNRSFKGRPTQVSALWITLFKQVEDGILYIKNPEPFPLATNNPDYKKGRNTRQYRVIVPFLVLHQSWARTEEEIAKKLANWGHANDFNTNEYVAFWKGLNKDNYAAARNFHPMNPKWWTKLEFAEGGGIQEVLANLKNNLPKINHFRIFTKNLGQKFKFKRFF
ncbi:hypothetical protein ACLI09_04485 [Flavobacterium sp. RHBU_24]|uniref:hypothetical protein n=1 Tax=Flavobacterium sp. RHBU_24 TaxID=3391185 RepID=UPI0039847568